METLPFLFSSASNKQPSPAKATKVLLLCVKNKAKCLLTETYLYNLFSEHGIPQKILIFEKNIIWKAFIEMDSLDSAVRARNALNNMALFADGSRINIYFSDRETINFTHSKQSPEFLSPAYDPEVEKPFSFFGPNTSFGANPRVNQQDLKFHSNQDLFQDDTPNNNIDTFSSTPVNHNPRSLELSYVSPIESRKGFPQHSPQKGFSSCGELDHYQRKVPAFCEELPKKEKKAIRLMLSSTPFEGAMKINNSSNPNSESNNNSNKSFEPKRNSYTIIDSIKEEPLEKSPQKEKKQDKSFHSLEVGETAECKRKVKLPKTLKLFVPLSNSFNSAEEFFDEDQEDDLQVYPEKNDEIVLKNLPKKNGDDLPDLISRTPSPIPNGSKGEKLEDENFLKLLPLDENMNSFSNPSLLHLIPSNINLHPMDESKDSMDSEYDNYHKYFDNLVLIEEKKSSEETKKSQEALMMESSVDQRLGTIGDKIGQNGKNSFANKKAKTDQEIMGEKRAKQLDVIEKIEQDIQKSTDSYYKNSIKNIDTLLGNAWELGSNSNNKPHVTLPPNIMTNSCGYSDASQSLTPINFLNISSNQVLFGTPSPSHFERFVYNAEPENFMTNSTGFPGENKKSKVLYVRGLESEYVSLKVIYNLFSNFGNILKIIFLKKKCVALVDYETVLNASHAKDHLNNIIFFENPIKIFYSNYAEINLKSQEAPSEEVFIGSDETFRFKRNKPISINPPSNVLHVSNLKKDVCKTEIIYSIFNPYGTVEGIKFLVMDHYKNMCLVKYATLEQSLMAMAFLHGKEIMSRKLQISFTRTKI